MSPRLDPTAVPVEAVLSARGGPLSLSLSWSQAELEAFARRAGIPSAAAISAEWQLSPGTRGAEVDGTCRLVAEVTLMCRASGEPFSHRVEVPVSLSFTTRSDQPLPAGEAADPAEDDDEDGLPWHLEEGEEDPPEPVVNGLIDLKEATEQSLILEIPPWPRRPDAPEVVISSGDPDAVSPFAVLKSRFGQH